MPPAEKKPANPTFLGAAEDPDQIAQFATLTTGLLDEPLLPARPAQDFEYGFPLLESRNPVVRTLIRTALRVAPSQAPILLCGETGTGKEILARFIHRHSHRAEHPFVVINCAAIPDNLLESELFGYRRGAFTEARRDKKGQLVLAHSGTILLDEIAEMSPGVQGKLLRFVQERTILPLGATKPIYLDVRILAATNYNLEEAIVKGAFRRDLYYRLNVFQLELLPLRQRAEDIPSLAPFFIERFNRENETAVQSMADTVLEALANHSWPGNIRELENVIHHAVILAGEGIINLDHLPPDILGNRSEDIFLESGSGKHVHQNALSAAILIALQQPWADIGHSGRLGQSVPLEHLVGFFIATGGRPFTPRAFASHISLPNHRHRRDKLSNQILRTLRGADILGHNGRRAQAARYYLRPRFILNYSSPRIQTECGGTNF
jgi:transcriptional regulator with PAS, ATPase and Fis domain